MNKQDVMNAVLELGLKEDDEISIKNTEGGYYQASLKSIDILKEELAFYNIVDGFDDFIDFEDIANINKLDIRTVDYYYGGNGVELKYISNTCGSLVESINDEMYVLESCLLGKRVRITTKCELAKGEMTEVIEGDARSIMFWSASCGSDGKLDIQFILEVDDRRINSNYIIDLKVV